MVHVLVELDGEGCLRVLQASGHTGAGSPGRDMACAAVSALVRSAARLLYGAAGLSVDGQAPGPGRLELRVLRCSPERRGWLQGVTDVLVSGLRDVGEEHPGSIRLEMSEAGKQEY